MDLHLLRDRRVALAVAGGAAVVLLAALAIAIGLGGRGRLPPALTANSDSPTSLQVEMGSPDSGLDLTKPLRCFVGGQFVGMLSLKACAEKNGVGTGALDVGLDTSGEVAAATSDAAVLQPLPVAPEPPAPLAAAAPAPAVPAQQAPTAEAASTGPTAVCWRYAGDWRKVSEDLSLDACVQALYAGRCERPGEADYGRWNSDTLRLVTGKVERSGDGHSFHTLVKQPPGDCALPHLSE